MKVSAGFTSRHTCLFAYEYNLGTTLLFHKGYSATYTGCTDLIAPSCIFILHVHDYCKTLQ